MQTLTFITTNSDKLRSARHICAQFDITVAQVTLDILEIQNDDGEVIARGKAQKAYNIVQKPLIVCDYSWIIPGLKGFPGPYMKSVNHWFTAEDFLRLTLPLTDRRVFLRQIVVLQDASGQHIFTADISGTLLKEIRGQSHNPNDQIISFNGKGLSTAEVRALGRPVISHHRTVWHELSEWLQGHQLSTTSAQ